MQQVFNRIAQWNAKRYSPEYSQELTITLLAEEYEEWRKATDEIDQVHELCDIMYVAFGAIWKLDVEITQELADVCIKDVDALVEASMLNVGTFIGSYIDSLEMGTGLSPNYKARCLYTITMLVQAELMGMGLTFEQTIEAMLILCDSNDSKPAKKTRFNIKANEGPKDKNYLSPVPRLTKLLEEVCEKS